MDNDVTPVYLAAQVRQSSASDEKILKQIIY